MCFRPAEINLNKNCPKCNAENPMDATVCSECGAELPVGPVAPGIPGAPGAPGAPSAPKAPGAPRNPIAPR